MMSVYSYNQMEAREQSANQRAMDALPSDSEKSKRLAMIKKAVEKR